MARSALLINRHRCALLVFGFVWAVPFVVSAQVPSGPHVSSTRLPISVYYLGSATETVANRGLGYAEAAWDAEITNMGFPEPLVSQEDGSTVPGLLIVLDPSSNTNRIEATAGPTGSNACASKVVIPTTSPNSFFEMFVSYGLAVAAENAANCHESAFAFQPSAVAVTVVRWPTESTFMQKALPTFQAHPNLGVNCMFTDPDRYFYGAGSALLMLFLDQAYGQGDGSLLADIWQAAAADTSQTPNFLTALTSPLAGTTLDDAFVEFARWRYFVGANDDGEHFLHGGDWGGREVTLDSTRSWAELPILLAVPAADVDVLGSGYVALNLAGSEPGAALDVAFTGDESVRWHVDLLLVTADKTAQLSSVLAPPATTGTVSLPGVGEFATAVLVVSNLGDGEHDPDVPSCDSGAAFRYSFSLAPPSEADSDGKAGSGCTTAASAAGAPSLAALIVGLWLSRSLHRGPRRRRVSAAMLRAGCRDDG